MSISIDQILELRQEGLSIPKIAKQLGIHSRTVSKKLAKYRRQNSGRPEFENPTVFAVSAYEKTGDPTEPAKWVKYRRTDESQKILLEQYVAGLRDDFPRTQTSPQILLPCLDDNLLNCFIVTDYHLGMYAWHEESGEDWDIKIAEQLIIRWIEQAINSAPKASTAILAQLGDFLHFDGLEAVTPQNRHILDADTRFQLLIRSAVRITRYIIQKLLDTHNHVHVIMAMGNHDQASSAWLREFLAMFYENEPRVTVDTSADAYYAYKFENVSLFFHHGHKRNLRNVDAVFAGKFRDIYGTTKYSYGHLGHLHNDSTIESNLMSVTQHPTLAAKDAYASHGGWLSERAAKVITYHRRYGMCGEVRLTPEMVGASAP